MERIYSCKGTVSRIGYDAEKRVDYFVVDCLRDDKTPPVWMQPCHDIGKYLIERDWTDVEERYIDAIWYYDSNLFLRWIEIPSTNPRIPAKVIAMDMTSASYEGYGTVTIFGPQDYIEVSQPEPMTAEQFAEWNRWKWAHIN